MCIMYIFHSTKTLQISVMPVEVIFHIINWEYQFHVTSAERFMADKFVFGLDSGVNDVFITYCSFDI